MTEKQRTLKESIVFNGVGLHTGKAVTMEICPAADNQGYKFQRVDLENQPIIKADVDFVVATDRGTTLEQNGARVYTTEHVLAALYACQVDNALIKINGPEVPIMDGSSILFVNEIERVGFENQTAEREYFELNENIPREDLDKGIEFFNSERLMLLTIGNIVAFIVAMIAINGFISYLSKHGFKMFGWYRIIVGAIIIILIANKIPLSIV
jgi:UDP-3-O-[3-hydroxymyristoyl] N-acetylglucosamine deacetylase/3-hydroxyacyl-[acyl-carrier-protein] dehydratase